MLGQALLVFALTCACDVLWVSYIRHTSGGRALKAATFAGLVVGMGSLSTFLYVHDIRMILPAVLGAFLGTYLCVRHLG